MNATELIFVLDASGSMYGLESDTIGGVNATLAKHRELEGDAYVTLIQFSDSSRYMREHVAIDEVKDLTSEDYHASGCTALLDAVGEAIQRVKKSQKKIAKSERPSVIFVVITDGEENSSREFTYEKVAKMIKKAEKKGWEFLFLGANIDAAAEASRLGIARKNAVTYTSDRIGTQVAYEAVASASASFRSSGVVLDGWSDSIVEDAAARTGTVGTAVSEPDDTVVVDDSSTGSFFDASVTSKA